MQKSNKSIHLTREELRFFDIYRNSLVPAKLVAKPQAGE